MKSLTNKGSAPYRRRKPSGTGFVMLFAITIASILLSIALGVANVSLKELKFSASGRDANDAFLAADTGIEYALYNDRSDVNSYGYPASGAILSNSFVISGIGATGTSCVKVNITKDNTVTPMKTTISSSGYNVGDGTCSSTSFNRTERKLVVTYNNGVPSSSTPQLSYSGPVSGTYTIGSGSLNLNISGEYTVIPSANMTIIVKAWGGGGGTISPSPRSGLGGGGGFAQSSINLISGTPYKVWVAGGGAMSRTGGFGGGGTGGAAGGIGSGPGGGGGGSSVFFDSDNVTRKVSAGGGGGGGSTGDGDSGSNNTDSDGGPVGSNGVAGYQGSPCGGGAAAGLYTGNYANTGGNGGDGGRTGAPEDKLDNAGGGGGGGGGGGTGGGGGAVGGYCSGGGGGGGANLGGTSTQNGSGANPGNNNVANGWDSVAGIGGNGAAGNRGLIIIQ